MLPDALEAEFVQSSIKVKQHKWNDYSTRISAWELEHTLNC